MKRKKWNTKNRESLIISAVCLLVCTVVIILSLFLITTTEMKAASGTGGIFHTHVGDGLSEGGCYTAKLCDGNLVAKTREITCGAQVKYVTQTQWCCINGHVDNNNVGNGWYEFAHNERCGHVIRTETYYACELCGKEYSSIQGRCSVITGYIPSCGYEEGEKVAELMISTSTDAWTQELTLYTCVQSLSDQNDTLPENWKWSGPDIPVDAQQSTNQSMMVIRQNGTYCVCIDAGDMTSYAEAFVTVSNIDRTAPMVESCSIIYEESNTVAKASIRALDLESGLAENPYSWDGGNSYTSSAEQNYSANGTYSIIVKDRAGNQINYSFEITGIKKITTPVYENSNTQASQQGTKVSNIETIDIPGESNDVKTADNAIGVMNEPTYSSKLTTEVKNDANKITDEIIENNTTDIYFGMYSMEDLILRKTGSTWGVGDVGNLITLEAETIPGYYGVGELRFSSCYTDQILGNSGNYVYDENMNRIITIADTHLYEAIEEENSIMNPLLLFPGITVLVSGIILALFYLIRR